MKAWDNKNPNDIQKETGLFRTSAGVQRKFKTRQMDKDVDAYKLRVDCKLQERSNRRAMQSPAQGAHTGEERWSNCDEYMTELVSSSCAIV
eukprot:7843594-Lingulodinium_polyedra.AAC.1